MEFFDTGHLRTEELFLALRETVEGDADKRFVPSYRFSICRTADGAEVGECSLRVGNTEKLFFNGNIGYAVHKSHRGNRYAARACLLLFQLARMHALPYLIITCSPDNAASRRTCELAGRQLLCIADLPTDNDMYQQGLGRPQRKCIYRMAL